RVELVERQPETGAAERMLVEPHVGRRHRGERMHQRRANVARRIDERTVEIEADELVLHDGLTNQSTNTSTTVMLSRPPRSLAISTKRRGVSSGAASASTLSSSPFCR